MAARRVRTRVGIVGAGPAGLTLARLLGIAGVDAVVVDHRSRRTIETTQRAGILEQGTVDLLRGIGLARAVEQDGGRHDGVVLRFQGRNHRIDLRELVGRSVWLYPQHLVVTALGAVHERDGGDVRWDVSGVVVDPSAPTLSFTQADGTRVEVDCEVLVGADGSRSTVRDSLGEGVTTHFLEYPYAWFGLLVEAPPSAAELVYTRSERGFALVSQRSPTVQRMYFQCAPTEDPQSWSEDRIWSEMQARLAGPDGFRLREGRVLDRSVVVFRSAVHVPLRHGPTVLVGDAAHTVPPTGAKGLNLAIADVAVLAEALVRRFAHGDGGALEAFSERALRRVWRAQSFSAWLTQMLHVVPGSSSFERLRAEADLTAVVGSPHGRRFLADGYTGWQTGHASADGGPSPGR